MKLMGKNNMLPTGWIGILIDIVSAYSCLCVYHGRTPLWPKRELSMTKWGQLAPPLACISCLFSFVVLPVVNAMVNKHQSGADYWYITSLQLYPLGLILMGTMLLFGVLSYMLGLDSPLPSKPDGDEKSTVPSLDTESKPESTGIDIEEGKITTGQGRRSQQKWGRLCLCVWILSMATHAISLHISMWRMGKAQDEATNWFASTWFLLVLISGFCMGGIRYSLERKENATGWDLLVRFLAFFFFFFTVVTHICTQVLLAATSHTMLGGLPVLDGLDQIEVSGCYFGTVFFVLFA